MNKKAHLEEETCAAYEAIRQREGRIPTLLEMAAALGISKESARWRMVKCGLERLPSGGAGGVAAEKRTAVSDEAFGMAHAKLTRELKRPPAAHEMRDALGLHITSVRCRMKRLGLERYVVSAREAGQLSAAKRWENGNRPESAKTERKQKPMQVQLMKPKATTEQQRGGDGPGVCAGPWTRAGSECRPNTLRHTTCAQCGKEILIRPYIWPFYKRLGDGAVRWMCSRRCEGFDMW